MLNALNFSDSEEAIVTMKLITVNYYYIDNSH